MKRTCAICSTTNKKYIYTQSFVVTKSKLFSYDVTLCRKCGFLFADNIPSQKEYNVFYKNNSKYTYNKNIPLGLKKIYKDIFLVSNLFLKMHFPELKKRTFKILDIGCSIGYILKLFKDVGFMSTKGIEPSSSCKSIAKKLYGIQVVNCSLAEFQKNEKFDLIIMTGILEHLCDLNGTLHKVYSLLNNDGLLMVAVPDVDKFSKNPIAPFDEFSLEHINYFNRNTLSSLMSNHCFKNIYSKSIEAKFYDSKLILSFFKKVTRKEKNKKDNNGYFAVKRYILRSTKRLKVVNIRIDSLIDSSSKIVIWGAGSLTARLLASTGLSKTNIKFLVDSNKGLQGKKMGNMIISSPNILKELDGDYKVFISSYIYGKEIKDTLIKKYHFRGEIITL
jgi:2-polyprenyl-3-methyl-5-hydroxy-6-metoxy-1,4-benzoquinol methylase